MTREQIIGRLGALRSMIDRELGVLLSELESARGKHGVHVAACDVCGADDWRDCRCDPNSDANAEHVARLLRTGVGTEAIAEAERLITDRK